MTALPTHHPPRVLLLCSGLDHARRGFESFARECFDELRHDPGIDLTLIKGSGPAGDRERVVRTLLRTSPAARFLGRALGRAPYRFEHLAFALSVQPLLRRHAPDVVYFSEWHTGIGLALLRRATRRPFRLALSNGTMAGTGFDHLDHVQQLTPIALDSAVRRGADPQRQTMLPLGFAMDPDWHPVGSGRRASVRQRLGLPEDRQVLLSVAALNRHHKRIDYLIEEVAHLPHPRPFLLMAGEEEADTEALRRLAAQRLGEGHLITTVPQEEMPSLYAASDAFVLTSLGEAQGRALIEAMAHGLECFVHDYEITRFALGEHGRYADLSVRGGLAGLLQRSPPTPDESASQDRHRFVHERFSWERLRPRYVQWFADVARAPVLTDPRPVSDALLSIARRPV